MNRNLVRRTSTYVNETLTLLFYVIMCHHYCWYCQLVWLLWSQRGSLPRFHRPDWYQKKASFQLEKKTHLIKPIKMLGQFLDY